MIVICHVQYLKYGVLPDEVKGKPVLGKRVIEFAGKVCHRNLCWIIEEIGRPQTGTGRVNRLICIGENNESASAG
jgi:hypothetical protein